VRLPDTIRASSGDADCAAFQTADQQLTTLSLPAGAISDCAVPPVQGTYDSPTHWSHMDDSTSLSWDGATITLTRKTGTPLIGVRTSGAADWSVELPYVTNSFETPAFVVDGILVVIAERLGEEEDRVYVVGIDVKSGTLRYETPLVTGITGFHGWAGPAGDRALVIANGKLSSLQVETGEIVWSR
jgi:hypothetical protein